MESAPTGIVERVGRAITFQYSKAFCPLFLLTHEAQKKTDYEGQSQKENAESISRSTEATKGSAFGFRKLPKKLDQNFHKSLTDFSAERMGKGPRRLR